MLRLGEPGVKQTERITDTVRHHLPNPLSAAFNQDILRDQLRGRRRSASTRPLPFVILCMGVC